MYCLINLSHNSYHRSLYKVDRISNFEIFIPIKSFKEGDNIIMSAILNAAIKNQLTNRTKRNAQGQLLCRRCDKVVPPEYSIVFWNPSDESKVWGPCCSDECICHLKICSGCNQDFVIDKPEEITHIGDGTWLCKECIKTVKLCTKCNKKGTLKDSPIGEICTSCYEKHFFTCSSCGQLHPKTEEIKNKYSMDELVKWTHVIDIHRSSCSSCYEKAIKNKKPLAVSSCKYCSNTFALGGLSDDFCDDCIKRENVKKCDYCKKYVTRWDRCGGKLFCKVCRPLLTQCSCCKEQWFIKNKDNAYRGITKVHQVCDVCLKRKRLIECPSCLSLTTSALKKVEGKKDACSHCFGAYRLCSTCGEYHFGERECRGESSSVSDYSYKPMPYFNYTGKLGTFFGFENEINYSDSNYSDAKTNLYSSYKSNVLYSKRDGSIHGQGFEIVSHPMTLDFFDTVDLEPMFRVKPMEKDTSCGLHVHISRESFSGQTHLYKLTEFINGNTTFIKKIAGRDFNGYAKKYSDKISKAVKGTTNRDRYHAVNLTNKNTVEIRIFKSARNEFQLRSRIEFVNALVEFTRNTSLSQLKPDHFKEWLKRTNGYNHLKTFLDIKK